MNGLAKPCSSSSEACGRRCRKATSRARRPRLTQRSPRSRTDTGRRTRLRLLASPDADLAWSRKARRAAPRAAPPPPPPQFSTVQRPSAPAAPGPAAPSARSPSQTGAPGQPGATATPVQGAAQRPPPPPQGGSQPAGSPHASANSGCGEASRSGADGGFASSIPAGCCNGQPAFLRIEDRPDSSVRGSAGRQG